MKQLTLLFWTIIFHHLQVQSPVELNLYIFWSIGQGQWVSHVTHTHCEHFDAGGSIKAFKANKHKLRKLCGHKYNYLYLSHPDLDHYSLINPIIMNVKSACWQDAKHPQIETVKKIKLCPNEPFNDIEKYHPVKTKSWSKNESSIVYRHGSFLFPGDSTQKNEKVWIKKLNLDNVNFLLLGHHGSRTSTSDELIKQLPKLKMAIVQSLVKKYGHPHKIVQSKLKAKKIPLLRTEEWGNIVIKI